MIYININVRIVLYKKQNKIPKKSCPIFKKILAVQKNGHVFLDVQKDLFQVGYLVGFLYILISSVVWSFISYAIPKAMPRITDI
mgnify:CR=1 FL=1